MEKATLFHHFRKKGRHAMDQPEFDNKFFAAVYKLNKTLGKIESVLSIIILWALIAVVCIFISCRFIFHISTPWADESARYLLILLGWMGASYAASNGDHLEIDILGSVVKKRAKNPEKILAITDRISQILSMLFLAVFLYVYTEFVLKMAKTGTPSAALPVEMWVPMSFVVVGVVLVFLHTLCHTLLPRKYWHEAEESKQDKKAQGSEKAGGE